MGIIKTFSPSSNSVISIWKIEESINELRDISKQITDIKNEIKEMEYYDVLIKAFMVTGNERSAEKYILDAYDIIMERSFKIKDRDLRKAYIEKNHWNKMIIDSYNNLNPA